MSGLLAGKVCLIVGGGSGIGAAAARLAVRDGAKAIVADIAEDAAGRVAADCGADAMTVDVRSSASVKALVEQAVARYERIDGVFHTAMSVPLVNKNDRRVTELPEAIWESILSLVLTGTYHVCKYFGQQMLRQRVGSIVLTATSDALIGQAGIDAYTAAKGGVIAMTRSIAAGLSPEGVRVNAVCPSFVETPHQRSFLDDPAMRSRIEAMHLMPIMTAEDPAELALFLLSDRARYLTGGIYVCDAGYTSFKGRMDVLEIFDRTAD